MQYQLKSNAIDALRADLYILGVFKQQTLSPLGQAFDKKYHRALTKALKQANFTGKIGELHWITHIGANQPMRMLCVGCGENSKAMSANEYQKALEKALKAASETQAKKVYSDLTMLPMTDRNPSWSISQFVQIQTKLSYRYQGTSCKHTPPAPAQSAFLLGIQSKSTRLQTALDHAIATADGMNYCRDLANLPPNICNPSYLAKQAQALAKKYSQLKTTIVTETKMRQLGMGALLAVSAGSDEEAKLIVMQYQGGNKKTAPIALVGKGITFDTGGLSLKSPTNMIGMKYDMAGSASVFGVMKAIAECRLPLNVVGVVAASENAVNGHATRPEDVVTSLSGQTIEILNTDAEGRLVLADAITYTKQYLKPKAIIDIATLTGAMIVALGHKTNGLMTNNQHLADEVLKAGEQASDRAWQLPLFDEYQEGIHSTYADLKNIANPTFGAQSIIAGCFLSQFAKDTPWVHLDVAGTAIPVNRDHGATGRPVPLLMQYLINQA